MSIIKMLNLYRYYQQEADDAIYDELLVHNKCIVKMFCGTGKSLLMRNCKIIKNQQLVVYVVPSLSLIDQFYTDYFTIKDVVLKVSSQADSTTDKKEIVNFLKKKKQKIVCVTYASYETILQALGDTKINVCIFDEAHHAVGESYQSLIFENDACEKQIFFTATPKNANGIVMYDKDAPDSGVCGKLVYDYSYFKGVMEQYLNPFEIRVDFYTENTNNSVYESIARAIFASGNSRCLTFHADVNGDRDRSVTQFVNQEVFIRAFNHVLETEFPEKAGYYTKVKMIALSANINVKDRKNILAKFDVTPDNEVCIISSCQTIGEGVDTKNANMCVFVDPKSSYVSITQNIGRIVRKNPNIEKPNSTILIPCWVDKEKYLGCNGDRDKCDEVIRQDMNKEGNFNGILNVMSALKQEDEDLFDACLHYPDTYSPQEIEGNLAKYGYKLEEPVSLLESLEHVLDAEVDIYEDEDETEEEMLTRVAEENDVVIEVHTNSLETPIEYYGEGDNEGGDEDEAKDQNDTEVVRIFKSYDEELEENVYQPIVKKDGPTRNTDRVEPLSRDNRFNVKVHTNPDVTVLWSVSNSFDLSKDICSCIIDCNVVDMWPQRFEELKKYIDENNMTPPQSSKNKNIASLGSWLSLQTQNYKNKSKSMKNILRYDLWTQFLEKYKEYFISNDETWNKQFEELKAFIDDNKRRPHYDGSQDKNEKIIGKWLSHNLGYYKNKTGSLKDEIKYNLWRQFLEKYKEYFLSGDERWFKNLTEIETFINIHKRKPTARNDKEIFLSGWLNNQLKIKNTILVKLPNRYQSFVQFLEKYKKYFMSTDDYFDNMLLCVKKFIDDNQRRPFEKTGSESEKKLGRWFTKQIMHYKQKTEGMSEINRYDEFTKFIHEYKKYVTIDREDEWHRILDDVVKYIEKHTKKPPRNITIGAWINTQHIRFKNAQIIKKYPKRYALWTQFLEDYKEYFNATQSVSEEHPEEEEVIKIKPRQKKSAKLTLSSSKEEKVETPETIRNRTTPVITQYHNKFLKMRSNNLAQHFKENPEDFVDYHRVRDENFKTYPSKDIPCNRVIAELDKIKTKRTQQVVDMGCGTAPISKHFKGDSRFQFINYDHVAIDDTIQVCDISQMPLENDSVEICIMSLALWGPNCVDYIRDAHRVLETHGKLYIIDSTKRWTEKDEQGNMVETKLGKQLMEELEKVGFTISSQNIDRFCSFQCYKA